MAAIVTYSNENPSNASVPFFDRAKKSSSISYQQQKTIFSLSCNKHAYMAAALLTSQDFLTGPGQSEGGCGRGCPPPTVGSFFVVVESSCIKMAFLCTLNVIIRGIGYVKWHIPIPYFPLFFFNSRSQRGGGGGTWALVPLSYASDSGTARICQPRANARERIDRAGGGCGFPLPRTVGISFFF